MSIETSTDNTEQTNYLDMSDEEISNMSAPAPGNASSEEESADYDTSDDNEDSQADEAAADQADDEDAGGESVDNSGDEDTGSSDKEVKEKSDATEDDKPVDYEAAYKQLFAPFKANGKMIEVATIDDAKQLMQMGAHYNKKMAALKPNMRVLKLLQNHDLLDEQKLAYLIDLDKKNPAAINKLVKDSGIDPMDLDAEKAGEYSPKIHAVDDREIALDTVLDEIQDTESYTRTIGIVSKEWDGASKQVVAEQPQLLKVINDHVDRGIYDLISNEVERERMLGRLNGLSDIEAYKAIGDKIEARGGFAHLGSAQGQTPATKQINATKPSSAANDEQIKDKKRAASSTKPGKAAAPVNDFNPLELSDEEFMKLSQKRFK